MANLLYVDNSNVWIEGMHVAAFAKGLAPNIWAAVNGNLCDYGWKLDFGKLFAFAGGEKKNVRKATLFGSRSAKNATLWNVANHEKKVDTDIVATMIEDSYEILKPGDEITLVSGDSDYVPAIEKLKKRGIPVHVIFWSHAARELKNSATSFTELNQWLVHLSTDNAKNSFLSTKKFSQ
jgi:uncharacterized LabA/DUF88 family protein